MLAAILEEAYSEHQIQVIVPQEADYLETSQLRRPTLDLGLGNQTPLAKQIQLVVYLANRKIIIPMPHLEAYLDRINRSQLEADYLARVRRQILQPMGIWGHE